MVARFSKSFLADNTHHTENARPCATRVFFRNGSAFDEIHLPELPSPKLPEKAAGTQSDAHTTRRLEPVEWLKTGELVLESEVLNEAWGRAASKITIGFDSENPAAIRNVEQQKMSIVDYFLLLPANQFEGPPSIWLRHAQTRGHAYLCEAESREKNIDEKNGYISCGGDGAQSSFDVALFRYRDGRPLLALCHAGELVWKRRIPFTYTSPSLNWALTVKCTKLIATCYREASGVLYCLAQVGPFWYAHRKLRKWCTNSPGTARSS